MVLVGVQRYPTFLILSVLFFRDGCVVSMSSSVRIGSGVVSGSGVRAWKSSLKVGSVSISVVVVAVTAVAGGGGVPGDGRRLVTTIYRTGRVCISGVSVASRISSSGSIVCSVSSTVRSDGVMRGVMRGSSVAIVTTTVTATCVGVVIIE